MSSLPGKDKTARAILGWRVAPGGFGAEIDGLMGGFRIEKGESRGIGWS